MALSNPVDVTTNSGGTAPSSVTATVGATSIAKGDAIVVFISAMGPVSNPTYGSCTDIVGNTYTKAFTKNIGAGSCCIFYCLSSVAAMTGGDTITVSGITNIATGWEISVVKVPSPKVSLDHTISGVTNANTSSSMNTGTLLGPSTLVLMIDYIVSGDADGFTQDAAWTSLTPVLNASSLDALRPSFKIISGTGSVSKATTLAVSRGWATTGLAVIEFVPTGGGTIGGGTMSMMGV